MYLNRDYIARHQVINSIAQKELFKRRKIVAQKIAELKNTPLEEVGQKTSLNAKKVFKFHP